MNSAQFAQAYKASVLSEVEAEPSSTRTGLVCDQILFDLKSLRTAVLRMGRPGGSISVYRGLLLTILYVRSVANKSSPTTARDKTWNRLIDDLNAFDIRYGYGRGPRGTVADPSAIS